jgi:hypothetical protein
MDENFKNHAEEILESLGLFLGLDDLEFSEDDDTCILQLDEKTRVNISLSSENDTIILHSLMGTLPEVDRSEVVEQLFEANLFWAGTNGATISMERKTGLVIIAQALSLYSSEGKLVTGEALADAIASLASAANQWKKLLENQDVETSPPEEASSKAPEASSNQPVDITKFD